MAEHWEKTLANPALASQLTLKRVRVNRETGAIRIFFDAARLLTQRERQKVKESFEKEFPTIRVEVSFSYSCSFRFDDAGMAYVLERLFETDPGAQAFLRKDNWTYADSVLCFSVSAGTGRAFLLRSGADVKLASILKDEFSVEAQIKFEEPNNMQEILERIQEDRRREESRIASMQREQVQHEEKRAKARADGAAFGKTINDNPIPMDELTDATGKCTLTGEVLSINIVESKKSDTKIVTFAFSDYTDSVSCKLFLNDRGEGTPQEKLEKLQEVLKEGKWIMARGEYRYDEFSHSMMLMVSDVMGIGAPERLDEAEEKRVELHLHTQMSSMDACIAPGDAVKQAAKWGHKAIAITDHGVLQSFPEAFGAAKKNDIKFIPGCEGYLIEDSAQLVVRADERKLSDTVFVVVDVETTGLSPAKDAIIEIGAVKVVNGEIVAEYSQLINPNRPLPERITEITGISSAMLADKPALTDIMEEFCQFIEGSVLVAHNASFDGAFFQNAFIREGRMFDYPLLDTLAMMRSIYPGWKNHKLETVCKMLGIINKNAHRAVDDARATAQALLIALEEMKKEHDIATLGDMNRSYGSDSSDTSYHIILLAASQTGMTNLNRLVSEAHLHHYRRRPRIPRGLIQKHREGLIIGSACEAGELFRAIVRGAGDAELLRIARFYDYLEIQPIGNNRFMLEDGTVQNEEELRDFNRKIVWLGEQLNKPVVATGDVHFMEPRDATYRAIMMATKGFEDADNQAPLYFRTTNEMLEEFRYLGEKKAYEVVIKNPNEIADRVGKVRLFIEHPEGKETFQPLWPEAADELRRITVERAMEIYGDPLPEIVHARIEKELGAIIGYGFATLYMIAVKLVRKSMSDGYIVGSRGSVGSSAVAYFSGITEVDSLPPHYVCPNCKHCEFDVPEEYTCGYDLPRKACPECGTNMDHDGFNIPFEVFLGFKGDKVPDIDLNFSGVYQPVAHNYVKELFGVENVYRAGTIGTVADKTAYGYVLKYLEEREMTKNQAEKERLAKGIIGAKRTTGQHPAGMVVVPQDYEIYQFTAIQHPADDMTSETVTTHFDFNSMHDVLVKLDILGHDDPTMLRDLQDITGIAPTQVPLKDQDIFKQILSLFSGTSALGVTPEDIGVGTGTLGIPEFGTSFVRGMLAETMPSTMEELIRISGLSHGTGVWLGNTQDIVKQGIAPLKGCVCTRDDIMNQLMAKGVEAKVAFDTMESVRKGKGLKPFMEEAMRAVDTPEWFMECLRRIGYMFPKAHAAAYVMMALRIAYFKIYYPEAYYACYFKRNRESFDSSTMIGGIEHLRAAKKEILAMPKEERTDKHEDAMGMLDILIEMTARGIQTVLPDVYESDAERFLVIGDKKILPPLSTLPGVSIAQAQIVMDVRKEGKFLSQEDMIRRKIPKSVVESMRQAGLLSEIPESSQISLFEL
ncbi:MAG: PolC-type DNA polymerase III [Clostridiales bacterium]|nr:PolC-type DNA polymerase III [Clostridiales bacterium]